MSVQSGDTLRRSWTYLTRVRPAVRHALQPVVARAELISDPAVRHLAEEALTTKRFHCEGAAVLASGEPGLTRLIVLYQTLCDYLDTVTDRGPRLNSEAITALHGTLLLALDQETRGADRHVFGLVTDDGYLDWLVSACRAEARALPGLLTVGRPVRWLVERYGELQSLKHSPERARRAERLEAWADRHNQGRWPVAWWELAAAAGSTLGLFALLREAASRRPDPAQIQVLSACYFPWIGGLHILLDYLVDQEEDLAGHDFNFVRCYRDDQATVAGLGRLFTSAAAALDRLPDPGDHRWILSGLPTFYLADHKAGRLPRPLFRQVVRLAGGRAHWWLPLARLSRSP